MAFLIPAAGQAAAWAFGSAATVAGLRIASNLINGSPSNGKLDASTEDLVELAKKNELRGRCYGRETILTRIIANLGTKRGFFILAGPAGAGKTALVEEVAYRIAEGKIATLRGARVMRLIQQRVRPQAGLLGHCKELVFGSVENAIESLIADLQKSNGQSNKSATILFIDEIQDILLERPAILDKHKESLDQYGVIIIGATTDETLVTNLTKFDPALERRLTEIRVPAMTAEETLIALSQNRTIDPKTIYAIVYLSDYSIHARKNFPDKAIKFLDEVHAFAKNSQIETINAETVIQYLCQTSAIRNKQELATKLRNIVKTQSEQVTQENSFFKEHFSLLDPRNRVPMIEQFSHHLRHFMKAHSLCIASTNSEMFLRCAVACLSSPQTPIYRISLNFKGNIQLLKRELSKLENATLLLEDVTEDALRALHDHFPSAPSSLPIPPSVATTVNHFINSELGTTLTQYGRELGFIKPEPQQQNSSLVPQQDLSMIQALKADWISKGKPCIIAALPTAQAAIQSNRNVLRFPQAHLSVIDTINWLSAEAHVHSSIELNWIEKLVYLSYELWEKSGAASPVDFAYVCFQVASRLPLIPGWANRLICQSLEQVSNHLIPFEEAQRALEKISHVGNHFEQRAHLRNFSEKLTHLVDEMEPSSILKIEESEKVKREYLAFLIEQHIKTNGNPFVVHFTQIKSCFQTAACRNAYLEKIARLAERQTPVLIIDKEDLTHRPDKYSMICFVSPESVALEDEREQPSLVGQIMQHLGAADAPVRPARSIPWIDTVPSVQFKSPTFTKTQFDLFFQDLINQNMKLLNLNNAQKEQLRMPADTLKRGYYLLYTQSKPFTLNRIAGVLERDFAVLIGTANVDMGKTIEHFLTRYGNLCSISKEDILYEIDPSLVSNLYKLKRLVTKVVSFVARIVIAPFVFVWKELGAGIKSSISWLSGSMIFNFVRRYLLPI